MNQQNKLILYDFLILILATILLLIIRPDYAFLAIFLSIPIYLIISKRQNLLPVFLIATIQAALWMLVGNKQYGYNQEVMILFGLNVYPFLLWATGLFLVYLCAVHVSNWLKFKSFTKQFIVYILVFWFSLITIETLSYHVFLIRNAATGMYPGLPICECIHAPVWMQIVYLTMGPINFVIQRLIKRLFLNKSKPQKFKK
ncbi:hypothetical protein COV13_00515 [Candidatus Woesearchaeota archaeon CG10_big_fil_rev_8_21_14_0_10_32_9]|nr:MAG: hypothetical protein COV13_00515 [Candidatus Woesearchaeota archaeon CG10_big_fil_rev_8_21_14_0_10_32_9]